MQYIQWCIDNNIIHRNTYQQTGCWEKLEFSILFHGIFCAIPSSFHIGPLLSHSERQYLPQSQHFLWIHLTKHLYGKYPLQWIRKLMPPLLDQQTGKGKVCTCTGKKLWKLFLLSRISFINVTVIYLPKQCPSTTLGTKKLQIMTILNSYFTKTKLSECFDEMYGTNWWFTFKLIFYKKLIWHR